MKYWNRKSPLNFLVVAVDYWFNSEDRDKMLIQKVDEEDGSTLSNVGEYPDEPKKENVTPDE